MEDSVLSWGDDADVKGDFFAVDPRGDVDVGGARQRPWDKARHFRRRAERRMLRLLEDFVPYSVMPSTFHPVVVPAMKRVIAELVLEATAVFGATLSGRHQLQAKAIAHRRGERTAVEVEVERRVGLCVNPVSFMRS